MVTARSPGCGAAVYVRAAVVALACVAGGCGDPVGNARADPIALMGLTVLDGTGGPMRSGQTILIRAGQITNIGPDGTLELPDGVTVLDLAGKYALPGFIDVHAHMPAPEHQAHVLRTLLAFGITTVRSPASVSETGVELRARLERGELLGPRFLTAGPLIDAPNSPWGFAVEVTTEPEIRAEVARQAADGVDFIKLYSQLGPTLVAAGIDEAHAQGLKVIGHLGRTTWSEATASGIDALTHSFVYGFANSAVPGAAIGQFAEFFSPNPAFDPGLFDEWDAVMDFGSARFEQLVTDLTQQRVALDPNLVLAEAVAWGDDPEAYARLETELDALPHPFPHPYSARWSAADREAARAAFPTFLEGVRILHERGALLTVGTDLQNPWMTPGVSFHRELALLVQAGIPVADVLRIATRNGAESLGLLDETGTLSVGKVADVVILDADPLVDVANARAIHLVIRHGRVLAPADLVADVERTR